MKTTKKEKLMVELIGSFHQLKKVAFENLKLSFSDKKLSPVHWRLLCLLKKTGEKHPGELASELGITPSAVSQYINGLLENKLVTIKVDKDDRRLRLVKLSGKGKSFLNSSRKKTRQAFELLFADLTEEEIETLLNIFRKILKENRINEKKRRA